MCVIVCSDYKDPCTFGTDSDTLFSPVESYFSSSPLPSHSSNDLIDINTAGLSLVLTFFLTSLFAIHCTPFNLSPQPDAATALATSPLLERSNMPLKSTRSFSGKLLKRYRSKTKLNEEKQDEPVPALPIVCHFRQSESDTDAQTLPGLDVATSWNIPLSNTDGSSPSLPRPRIHRRSRSFSELLSIASNGTHTSDFAPAQPWRDREAWAAIHSPSQGPVKGRKDASVMDRTYGWMERNPEKNGMSLNSGRRDVKGRDDFKFFHNIQATSTTSLGERDLSRYPGYGKTCLHDSTASTSSNNTTIAPIIIRPETRPTSRNDSSSTISSMELSTNPHTPPTSIDQHSNPNSLHDIPNSATSNYSDDLPLPPLLPHTVKRADSPPAFTSRFPAQVPWAQRSTMKDIREASNLRWATGSGPSTPPQLEQSTTTQTPTAMPVEEPPRTPPPQHRRKRSMTAPSVFDKAGIPSVRPESGTLPLNTPSPPRPPRHPKRQTRVPPPIPLDMPVAVPYSLNPPSSTPTSREEDFTTPLSSPLPQSPIKAPSAFYKPTVPLRSVGSASSLRPGRRPSTAPTQGSALLGRPAQIGAYPSPPPSSTNRGFERLSRNTSSSSATRGGWI